MRFRFGKVVIGVKRSSSSEGEIQAYFGIGVRENDSDWRDTLNYCLHDLWTSGAFQKIYNKWFGPDSMCPVPLQGRRMEPFVKG
ncbi:MAG: transporter substrate-binding domain-containing protein [Phycisphaerae bacterium]|nr:transporter substrate-binding domain-containing protein [Phycisphaerae bacterium]